MDKQVMDKIFSYIDAMASKLGVASQYVFVTLVKQQVIQGIVDLFTSIIVLIVAFIGFKVITKLTVKASKEIKEHNNKSPYGYKKDWMDYPHIILPSVSVGIILIFAVLVTILDTMPNAILKISNPQYYAIQELLDTFK